MPARATGRLRRGLKGVEARARNAVDLLLRRELGAVERAPFEVVDEGPVHRLRHYGGAGDGPPLVLVPPLMLQAEVYDIAPDLSAVRALRAGGVDVWLVDFGAPEHENGLGRTLDDHVLAVDRAVTVVNERTGRPVHLAGYSQGGMFVYQAAAYRRGAGLGSLITFGSPVDIHRNLPVPLHDALAERLLGVLQRLIARPLARLSGLPGVLSSTGFKLLSWRKELRYRWDTLRKLGDREALEQRAPGRRFLGGEGFVAWPGPALRAFVDQMIVGNRMKDGGLVLDGRAVSLADLQLPVLAFIGTRDELARPAAVLALRRAAPDAPVYGRWLETGHFGMVVGGLAREQTWPEVIAWLDWQTGEAPRPPFLDEGAPEPASARPLRRRLAGGLWDGLGDAARGAGGWLDRARYQLPRLAELARGPRVPPGGLAGVLDERARVSPEAPFLLWRSRVYGYGEVARRVVQVAAALREAGVGEGTPVALLMGMHPDQLAAVTAVLRLGAVPWLLSPGGALPAALEPAVVVTDGALLGAAERLAAGRPIRVFGDPAEPLPPATVRLPGVAEPLPALPVGWAPAAELMLCPPGRAPLRVSPRRAIELALGAAGLARLTPSDTVYCRLGLSLPIGLLAAAGSALIAGSRLALGRQDVPFEVEVRRYGASVVFFDQALGQALARRPAPVAAAANPIRCLSGTGLNRADATALVRRLAPEQLIGFLAPADGRLWIAETSGHKPGALGRPLPGTAAVTLVADALPGHRPRRVRAGEVGRLLEAVAPGTVGATADVFRQGDAWRDTGLRLVRDADGDLWMPPEVPS